MRGFFSPIMGRRFSPPWSIALGPAKKNEAQHHCRASWGNSVLETQPATLLLGASSCTACPNTASDTVGGIMIAELLAMLIGHNELD